MPLPRALGLDLRGGVFGFDLPILFHGTFIVMELYSLQLVFIHICHTSSNPNSWINYIEL